jgi:hypothetical protein
VTTGVLPGGADTYEGEIAMSVVQPSLVAGVEADGRKTQVIHRSPLAPAYFIGRPAELWIYALRARHHAVPSALTEV